FKRFPGTDISDIDLDENFSVSVKAGHYFKHAPFLGIEGELNYSKPDFKDQVLTFKNAAFPGPIQLRKLSADVHDIGLAVSLMARSRKFKHFNPYVGVGPNVHYFIVRGTGDAAVGPGAPILPALDGDDIKQDKISVGIQAKAGVRIPVTEHFAFDVEYKFNVAPVQMGEFRNLEGYKGDFTSHQVMAGLTYVFGEKH
ncbi:MAG: outer membrane beta-barrel protein, partial [Candidatus Caenarcaniphilales bacterium]|nr:outer membrane beta-barrel protein [Candidatus Caenarcaniphilales bacterium]